MTPIVSGNPEPIEQSYRSTISRTNGVEVERTWRGTYEACKAMEQAIYALGASTVVCERVDGSAMGILRAVFSSAQNGGDPGAVAESTIELSFSDVTWPIHRNPTFIGISAARVQALNKEVEKESPSAPSDATELSYYNLKLRGVDEYRAKMPVVSLTRTVSVNYHTALVVADTGTIFSTAAVSNFIDNPILFTVPTGNVGVLEASGFTAGWMQDTRVSFTSSGSVQLAETYEFGLWENALYTFGS